MAHRAEIKNMNNTISSVMINDDLLINFLIISTLALSLTKFKQGNFANCVKWLLSATPINLFMARAGGHCVM